MQRYVQGHDRTQSSLLPASLEDYVGADNPYPYAEGRLADHFGYSSCWR